MSSWKNEGGNRVNNIVNARTDITNKYFSTDPTLSVNDREGIYFNKENTATVLGIGTKEPYSRFSFGDFITNNFDGSILKSESLVNTPSIALSEKNDGTNATGISFFYNKAGSGDSRGIRFTVNNNNEGTIFNSSLEPQAISDENTLMLMTNDGRTNSVLINTTSTNFANPKSGLEINGEIRATQGIILKALDSTIIDRQAGLIFYDINDRKIKWCTGSGDDIKSVVAVGEEGFVINTLKYDSNFAVIENLATGAGVLAFKDMAFAIGNGTMLETKYVGSNQQNASYLRENIPAFSIIGKTIGEDDYNANMMLSHIDYVDGTPILSATSESDLSMNGVLYLLNNLAIDVFNPKSIIDVSKNFVPFMNIGYNNTNYDNSVVIGCDLSGSKQSLYFGENILNNGSLENKFNLFFGKDITNFGNNNENNFIFGNSNNINFSNSSNNMIFGNALNLESDVSFCFVMGTNGTVNSGDLMIYFQEGIGEVFSLRSGGNLYCRNNFGLGVKDSKARLHIYRNDIHPNPDDYSHRALLIEANTKEFGGECSIHLQDDSIFGGTKNGQIISLVRHINSEQPTLCINPTRDNIVDTTEGLFINYNGKIGIGNSNPLAKLHISHSELQTDGYVTLRTEGTIRTYAYDSDVHIRSEITNNNDGGKMQLYNGFNPSEEIKIKFSAIENEDNFVNNGGNFGLGTTSPNELLTVKGNIRAGGDNISSIQLWNGAHDYVYLYSENGNGKIILKDQYSGDINRDKILISANGDTYFNGGNFGILTSNPNYALDISGTGDIFLNGDNQIIYFKDINNSISRVNDKLVFKTTGKERVVIDELGTIQIKGLLSIDDLTIAGAPFDAKAAASWNSTYTAFRSISVNFPIGINYENTDGEYRNFFPRYTLDVSGNIRGHNLLLGNYSSKIIPEHFNTSTYQHTESGSFLKGLYLINEKKSVQTYPAWQLFDGDSSTMAQFVEESIEEIDYVTMDNSFEDYVETDSGAYVEIILPKLWAIDKYSFSFNANINPNKLPKKWLLLGKTHLLSDQSIEQIENKWKLIDLKQYNSTWSAGLENSGYKNVFSIGEYAYNKERFHILRLVILETFEAVATDDNTVFDCFLSGFQLYGSTTDINLENNIYIQSTFNDSNVSSKNVDIVLQPYGNNVGIGNHNPEVILDISNNSAIRLPSGTTEEGNAVANIIGNKKGYIRFNTTKNQFEGYLGKNIDDEPIWRGLGGLIDTDQDTYITPEEVEEDNSLKFYTKGVKRLTIDDQGSFDISANVVDISTNVLHINTVSFNTNMLDISHNLNVLNDTSSNKIFSKNIYLDERTIRNSDVIKATHPEDSQEDLFKLTTREGIFNVTEDEDEGYYINDILQPTIHAYPGCFIQFNLDLEVETFNIYLQGQTDNEGNSISAEGLIHIAEDLTQTNGIDANNKLSGTLFWHIPINAVGVYVYQSGVTTDFQGVINVLPLPSDISNNFIKTVNLNTFDISGTNAEFNDISNNNIVSNFVNSIDISSNKIICYDKIGINYDSPNVSLYISANDSIKLPVGNDAERPTADFGLLRYNDESKQFEGCDGTNWSGLGGVISVDQETTITAQDNTFGQDGIGSLIFTIDDEEGMRIMGGDDGETRRIGVNTATPTVILDINHHGAIKIPVGTTQQGVDVETNNNPGYIRYNSQRNQLEGYDGSSWFSIAGPLSKQIDTDQDTYITVEENAGDNTLRFYTAGSERMTIANDGNIEVKENITIAKSSTSESLNTNIIKLSSRILQSSDILKRENPEDNIQDFFKMKSNVGFFDVTFNSDEGNFELNDVLSATIYAYPGNRLEFNLVNTESNGFRIYSGSDADTNGTDVDGLIHISDDKTIVTDDFSDKNSGILVWNIPFDAIGNFRYQSEFSNNVKGDIIILPRISDISSNHILTNELVIHNDLSGNNALLHDVSVNRLWIGQVEMIGYIPGNVENPMGLGELVGDFKVTEHTMLQSLDISKNLNIDYTNNPDNIAININGSSGSSLPQLQLSGSHNGMKITTNNTSNVQYALSLNSNTKEIFTVKNNGNIGVGTDDPDSLLHLSSTGDVVLRLQADSNNNGEGNNPMIEFRQDGNLLTGLIGTGNLPTGGGSDDNALYLQHCGSGGIVFLSGSIQNVQSASAERMRISYNGNVGIGAIEPEEKLDVRGNMRLGDGTTYQQALRFKTDEGDWQIGSNNFGNGTNSNQLFIYDVNSSSTYFTIQRGSGNVGINTSSAERKLHIKNGIFLIEGGDTQQNSIIELKTSTGKTNYILSDTSTGKDGDLIVRLGNNTNKIRISDGGENVNLCENGGNVAIGKDIATSKLDIDGELRTNSMVVNTSGSITLPWTGEIKISEDLIHKKVFTTGYTALNASEGGGNYINFSVAGNHGDNIDEIMRLSHYGYIGICNDKPKARLDIKGNASDIAIAPNILFTNTNTQDRNWKIGPLQTNQKGFQIICSELRDDNLFISGMFQVGINGNVSIGTDAPSNSNTGLTVYNALGLDDNLNGDTYTNSHQHNGQIRIQNGEGLYSTRAMEIALLDSGRGVIQCNENSVGYNQLDLNPAGGAVTIGRESWTNNSGLYINGYHTRDDNVGGLISINGINFYTSPIRFDPAWYGLDGDTPTNNREKMAISTDYTIFTKNVIISSDRRIKKNIVEVPDDLSLEKLRNIECKYYNYIDKFNRGTNKIIGFIAQQVNEHMPEAISIVNNFIPNVNKIIENPVWSIVDVKDNSNNLQRKYKLTVDNFSDVSNNNYRFYVSNDKGISEVIVDTKCIENNSFIFDNSWNNIVMYGKEVNDFHTLDKQKLFTLNFSATQEIDKIQQSEKQRLDKANEKISMLEEKNKQLEATLEQVLKRLNELENK